MSRILLLCLCLLGSVSAMAQPQDGDAILGTWEVQTPTDLVHIEVTRDQDVYNGEIIWIKEPLFPADDPRGMGGQPKVDRRNPDPALRTRPIIGVEVLTGMRYKGDGKWNGGSVYSPNRGLLVRGEAKLLRNGILRVTGFLGFALFSSSVDWRRVAAD